MKLFRLLLLGFALAIQDARPSGTSSETFESAAQLPVNWTAAGKVRVEAGGAFEGKNALVLSKDEASLRDQTSATGPAIPVSPGKLEVKFAGRSDLTSMDNSYNGTLALEFFNAAGTSLGASELGAWFRQSPWKAETSEVTVPDGAVSARFVATLNKETPGKFWLDGLSLRPLEGGKADDGLRRMMLGFSELGHLLYPETPRVATVEVWSVKDLSEKQREVRFAVRDYWGAEQAQPLAVTLMPSGKVTDRNYFQYEAKVDLGKVPLEVGKYYELHGEMTRLGREAFAGHTSFAILPEAITNSCKPGEIPFTSRTWDQRFRESPLLTKRLGIRFCNAWGRMTADPAKVEAAQIELSHELGLGVVTSSPAMGIEARQDGWKELLANDGALIRQGVRNFLAKYGHIKPMVVNLGNEPHNKGDEVKYDVEAYRIVYEEVKKIDPSIYVVGTSVGLEEEYFKQGFGQWLDAYDFHSYEDPESVRTIISEKYPEMFRKYGHAKPVWSTEIGMNSQGLTRQAVASLVYRKFANFFAGGGVNVSWFGLFYPDPDAKIHNTFASAHNVFDCRYNKYAPKLDAIAYYNAVNAIATKKFVTDKVYGGDGRLFLFRDREKRSLIVAYKDKGREDVFLPLPGVGKVEMIRLDGSRYQLDADGKGISFTLGEDPVLLLFRDGPEGLPETLERAAAEFRTLPAEFFRGRENPIEVVRKDAVEIELQVPPFWKVEKSGEGGTVRFALTAPLESQAREADLALLIRDGEKLRGLLSARRPVAGTLAVEMLPIPVGDKEGPGVRLRVQNNTTKPQTLNWNVALTGQQELKDGAYGEVTATEVTFSTPSSGVLEVPGEESIEIRLPLSGVEPVAVYHVKATVRDAAGQVITQERPVSGFVGVTRVNAPVKVDGILEESAWQNAPVQKLDDVRQFFGFALSGRPAPVWQGREDLSADLRFLWDDQFLYVAVTVKDDVAGATSHEDADLWRMDGLQFLVDPARRSKEKPGKYEYSVGLGKKGAQSWCTLSADALAPTGNAPDIRLAIHRDKPGTGSVTYEVAIPWKRLAPFQPEAGGNLGFTMIVNEDDGAGRDAFMTWFGNAHTKDVDTVGDLILLP